MKEVVFEVVVGILILSLLVVVINLFRGNVDIIGASADKVEEAEKIKADLAFNQDKKIVNGSDVIAAIRYYSSTSAEKVSIVIKYKDGTDKTYDNKAPYNEASHKIDYEKIFQAEYNLNVTNKNIVYQETG